MERFKLPQSDEAKEKRFRALAAGSLVLTLGVLGAGLASAAEHTAEQQQQEGKQHIEENQRLQHQLDIENGTITVEVPSDSSDTIPGPDTH